MNGLFRVIHDFDHSSGNLKYKVVDTAKVGAINEYLDFRREHNTAADGPEFPANWRCLSDSIDNRTMPDMVPGMGTGLMMRTPVFQACFSMMKEASEAHVVEVDGESITWFLVPHIKVENLNSPDAYPALFIMKKRYRTVCNAQFKRFWESQGFTGIYFQELTAADIN